MDAQVPEAALPEEEKLMDAQWPEAALSDAQAPEAGVPEEDCQRLQDRWCCICLESGFKSNTGIECQAEARHFVCTPCFGRHVDAEIAADLHVRQASNGLVRCPVRPCSAPAYSHRELALQLDTVSFDRYIAGMQSLGEVSMRAELETWAQKKVQAEMARLQGHDTREERAQEIRHRVVEDILTMKCPVCRQAFIDFDGCFALQCSRCGCGFCAWCGRYCATDAHAHVVNCPASGSNGNLFGTKKQYDNAMRHRRIGRLRTFLRGVDVEMREPVMRALRQDLTELGINTRILSLSSRINRHCLLPIACFGLLMVSLLVNVYLTQGRHAELAPGSISMQDIQTEAQNIVLSYSNTVRVRYMAFLSELRSDVEDMFFDLRDSLAKGPQGDAIGLLVQLCYAPVVFLACSFVATVVSAPVALIAALHGILATRWLQRWYIRGGRWLLCARIVCGPQAWQELLSKRQELVLKAVRHGMVNVDSTAPLTFVEPTVPRRHHTQWTGGGQRAWNTARVGGQCSLQVMVSAATAGGVVIMRHHPRTLQQKTVRGKTLSCSCCA